MNLDDLTGFAAALGAQLPDRALDMFRVLERELYRWNTTINLTRVPQREFALRHVAESLEAAPWLPTAHGLDVADIGTGAGFPGLVLAAVRPDARFVLVDSVLKKIHFIQHAARAMGLDNVEAIHGRAEEIAREPRHHRKFDVTTARAVAALDQLLPLLAPFAAPGGLILTFKGSELPNELAAADRLIGDLGLTLQAEPARGTRVAPRAVRIIGWRVDSGVLE